jgi:hypothetical protein
MLGGTYLEEISPANRQIWFFSPAEAQSEDETQEIGRVLKKQREFLILAETVCVWRFIQTV